MKTKTKMGLMVIVSTMFLLLFFGQPVNALTTTYGGTPSGTPVREEFEILQNKYAIADMLNFTSYNVDSDINGWEISIRYFTQSKSNRSEAYPPERNIDVKAWGADIPEGRIVRVDVTQWVVAWNSMGLKDVRWRNKTIYAEAKGVPDHGWTLDYPTRDPLKPGYYNHTLTIINDDSTDSLNVTGFAFNATMDYYDNLTMISFPSPLPDFPVGPGNNWSIPIPTLGSFVGGHIYFQYGLKNATGSVFFNATADHPVTSPPVGGVWVPVGKLGLLAPYIGLASTILVATAATAIYIKRRNKKQ